MVHAIKSRADLDQQLDEAGEKLVVIDFFATWCGPCKTMTPFIENCAIQYTDVVFLKVDVDENEDVSNEYSISVLPTFLFFKNKAKVDEFTGANTDTLKEMLEKHK